MFTHVGRRPALVGTAGLSVYAALTILCWMWPVRLPDEFAGYRPPPVRPEKWAILGGLTALAGLATIKLLALEKRDWRRRRDQDHC